MNSLQKPNIKLVAVGSTLLILALMVGLFQPALPVWAIQDPGAIGTISEPPGVDYISAEPGAGDIALLFFISRGIKVATVVAGLWVVFNTLLAGYHFIFSKGDSSAATKVRDTLTMSVVGLLLIITSYTIAGIIGLLIFGDANYILNPEITIT